MPISATSATARRGVAAFRLRRTRLRLRVGGDQAAGDLGARGFRLACADPAFRLVALKLGELVAIDARRMRGGIVGGRRARQRHQHGEDCRGGQGRDENPEKHVGPKSFG